MQRLFSMFPAGRPGLSPLIMRVALAVMLVEGVAGRLLQFGSLWYVAAPVAVAVALGFGFLTPVMAALTILLEIAMWATTGGTLGAIQICAVLEAIALALLGPGAYSLDSRRFGRRRVDLRREDD